MNAALPIALACAALGLALSLASRRVAWTGFACLALTALVAMLVPVPETLRFAAMTGLLITVVATAALMFFVSRLPTAGAVAAGINGGVWVGAVASVSANRGALLLALPLGLSFVLQRWLQSRGYAIVMKVLASWLIAIASLAILVSLSPTPGYAPDHMD
jgi:hypothetical protein